MTGTHIKVKKVLSLVLMATLMLANVIAAPVLAQDGLTGSITIEKVITGDTPYAPADFTFTVEGQPGTFTITGTDSITIDDIPEGVYTVTEINLPDNYSIGDYDQDVTVAAGQTSTVTFSNRYTRPTIGDLVIAKAITGDTPGEDAIFTFTVEGQPGTFTITGAGSTTITGIPEGVYTVTEINLPDYYSIGDTDEDVTIIGGQPVTVTFSNRYTSPPPPTTGNLTIVKEISGDEPPYAATFSFDVEGGEVPETILGEGSTTLYELMPGTYTIEEIDLPEGYSIEDPDQEITVIAGETAIATFTNTYTEPIEETGGIRIIKEITGDEPYDEYPDNGYPDNGYPYDEDVFTFEVEGMEVPVTIIGEGTSTLSGLEPGTYTVTEVDLPSRYSIWDDSQEIVVTAGQIADAVFTNVYDRPGRSGSSTTTYYTISIHYLDKATDAILKTSSINNYVDGSAYDVTSQAKAAIADFAWDSTVGDALAGTVAHDLEITSYYTRTAQIEAPQLPESPATPTAAEPEAIIVVDEEAPLGELPKTGTGPICPAPAQAAACLPEALVLNFKDEDEDDIA